MTLGTSETAAVTIALLTALVLGAGSVLLARLRRSGGLARALARTVLDASNQRRLLGSISTLAAMFVATAVVTIFGNLGLLSDPAMDALTIALFCTGMVALLAMIHQGFVLADLSLEDELDLRDLAPELFGALPTSPPDPWASDHLAYVGTPLTASTRLPGPAEVAGIPITGFSGPGAGAAGGR